MAKTTSLPTAMTGDSSFFSNVVSERSMVVPASASVTFHGSVDLSFGSSFQITIHMLLMAKGNWNVKKPAADDLTFLTWRSRNSLGTAWLPNSMEVSISKPNMFSPTTKDVGDSRETYSNLENSSQIFELKSKPYQSKQADKEITIYYNEMVTLWQEFDQCYEDIWENPNDCARFMKWEENDHVYMFLPGDNYSSDEVKGIILGRKPLQSIHEVFSEVRQEESRSELC